MLTFCVIRLKVFIAQTQHPILILQQSLTPVPIIRYEATVQIFFGELGRKKNGFFPSIVFHTFAQKSCLLRFLVEGVSFVFVGVPQHLSRLTKPRAEICLKNLIRRKGHPVATFGSFVYVGLNVTGKLRVIPNLVLL